MMRQNLLKRKVGIKLTGLVAFFMLFNFSLNAQDLLHYWNFNDDTDVASMLTPETSIGGAAITFTSNSDGTSDIVVGTGQEFNVENLNARNLDPHGSHLRFNEPADGSLTFALSTIGYEDIVVMFSTRRSGSGADTQVWSYSLNGGVDFTYFTTILPVNGNPQLKTLDFSSILGANNNEDFVLRVMFEENGNGGLVGNNRFDNFTVEGEVVSPRIIASPLSLSSFTQVLGAPSAEQTFTVQGTTLDDDITVTAPAEYEVSLTSGIDFASSVVISHVSGAIAPTTVYVRLNSLVEDTYTGDILLESPNATDVTIALTGLTSATPIPLVQVTPTQLNDFEQTLGDPSAEQVIEVTGEYLVADIVITAPAGFEVSLTSGTDFATTVSISPDVNDEVLATEVFVRLNDTQVGDVTGDLVISTTDAADITIELVGEVVPVPVPTITVLPETLLFFDQTLGFTSSEQEFVVNGINLEDDITVTAPANYEVSLTSDQDFDSEITIEHTAGVVTNVTVYVRLNASAVGEYDGDIVLTSPNADDVEIAVEGETTEQESALLYYWHFNDLTTVSDVTVIEADFTLITGFTGSFEYTDPITGERDIDRFTPGTTMNIQMGVTVGSAARVRNPSATRSLIFDVPTTGAENIMFTYAVQRSGNGMLTNKIEYSLNGTSFVDANLTNNVQNVDGVEEWQMLTYDFSAVTGANDNANFKIRITWEDANASNPSGNNRYDNITITGNLLQDDLSIAELNKANVSAYPNPFEDQFIITAEEMITQLYIFDVTGTLVSQLDTVNENQVQVNTAAFSAGLYTALVRTTNGYSQIKVIKK